jgi:hypothetical protein
MNTGFVAMHNGCNRRNIKEKDYPPVQPDEHWDGSQCGQAACQWIHACCLVHARSLQLQRLWVVCVLGLQLLHTGGHSLHGQRGLHLIAAAAAAAAGAADAQQAEGLSVY